MKPVILTFVGCYLPGFKAGGPIQTISNMVDRLGDEFDFKIVTSDRDLGDLTPYESVVINSFVSVGKAKVFYASPEMMRLRNLKHLINEIHYDILYLNSFFSYSFTIKPLILRRLKKLPNKPVIVAPRGEFSEGAIKRKWSKWVKKRAYLAFVKANKLYYGITWQASSEYEEQDIRRWFGDSAIVQIAPNLTPFNREKNQELFKNRRKKEKDLLKIIFLSRISPKKNLDGALRVLEKVRGCVEMNIYGPLNDEAYWEKCREIIDKMPNNVSITYKGSVPHEEVAKIMSEHDLFFFPTHGENFGHVIYEALSVGTPVLISDRTPWKSLEKYSAGWEFPLEDEEGFVVEIDGLCKTPYEEYHHFSQGACAFSNLYSEHHRTFDANKQILLRTKEVL